MKGFKPFKISLVHDHFKTLVNEDVEKNVEKDVKVQKMDQYSEPLRIPRFDTVKNQKDANILGCAQLFFGIAVFFLIFNLTLGSYMKGIGVGLEMAAEEQYRFRAKVDFYKTTLENEEVYIIETIETKDPYASNTLWSIINFIFINEKGCENIRSVVGGDAFYVSKACFDAMVNGNYINPYPKFDDKSIYVKI